MKLKIPRKIKIGSHWVTIGFEKGLLDNHGKGEQARLEQCELVIASEIKIDSVRTHHLIHGLMHNIDYFYNNYQLNEQQVEALTAGMTNLLDDLGLKLDWSSISEISKY